MSEATITVLGAAGEVTGSCYLVETQGRRILIDCGMFQGSREVEAQNVIPPAIAAAPLDAVLLTHAHLDHSGRLPLLVRQGYRGPIYSTHASRDFAKLILEDSARLQEADAERAKRKNRSREQANLPLYGSGDVETMLQLFSEVAYDTSLEIAPGITARFVDAGHMVGSASIELSLDNSSEVRTLVFSGDIGPTGSAWLEDPVPLRRANVAFVESTYGDRDHRPLADTLREAEEIMRGAIQRRAKILVPAFAVGRTQQILYYLAAAFRENRLPRFPIYIDSPMAIEATKLYREHTELFDPPAQELLRTGQLKRDLKTLRACQTAEESKELNAIEGPCLIMAGSGMCNGGRILHHLRHNLSNPNNAVIIVGYQSSGSIGRRLVDGEAYVKIFGETVNVNASVHTLGGFSAHAGQSELLTWVRALSGSRPRIILVHGEDDARAALAKRISTELGLEVTQPRFGEQIAIP